MDDRTPSAARLTVALVVVQVLFGGIAVAGKHVLPFVPPLALAFARCATAAVVLLALERMVVRAPVPAPGELARFALYALLGVALNQGLFLLGLERTSASTAVLLVATIPAFTLLVAVLLRHERAGLLQGAGLALSFVGVGVLVSSGGLDFGSDRFLGNLLVVANALSYSVYLVLSRPALARHDPLTVTAWVFLFGALEMALFGLPQFLRVAWPALPREAWIAFAYVLVGATVLTYGINNWVLRYAPASRVASFVYLQPVVGVLLAWLLLAESLAPRTLGGGLLVLLGVALANRAHPSRRAGRPF